MVEPFAPAIVGAVHSAFSIATASTFALGIGTSLLAAGLVLLFREAPAESREAARSDERPIDDEPEVAAA
ncbi:MAG: hypothetical protein E6I94_06890 [Chloroflexi bacterium]|nr:MAG: hypothetical protein E6I94_06890 [Chloroflexota bacterium]